VLEKINKNYLEEIATQQHQEKDGIMCLRREKGKKDEGMFTLKNYMIGDKGRGGKLAQKAKGKRKTGARKKKRE